MFSGLNKMWLSVDRLWPLEILSHRNSEWVVQMVMFQPPFSLKPYCLIRIWHFSNWNGTLPLHWININVNVTAFGSQRAKTDKMYKIQCNVFVLSLDWNSLRPNASYTTCLAHTHMQGCIFRLTCSHPELTEDHLLTSAYVKIFRTVTRNAVNKSVWRKKIVLDFP